MSKPVVELAVVQYASHHQIDEIVFRVYGGKSHGERLGAAQDSLEAYTEFFDKSEKTVVSVSAYECRQKFTPSGTPYVEFRYANLNDNNEL